ncbi:MAG: hypothetical protein WC737_05620 [Parcubacteria group bacterium]|jgi:hypothetical protein
MFDFLAKKLKTNKINIRLVKDQSDGVTVEEHCLVTGESISIFDRQKHKTPFIKLTFTPEKLFIKVTTDERIKQIEI